MIQIQYFLPCFELKCLFSEFCLKNTKFRWEAANSEKKPHVLKTVVVYYTRVVIQWVSPDPSFSNWPIPIFSRLCTTDIFFLSSNEKVNMTDKTWVLLVTQLGPVHNFLYRASVQLYRYLIVARRKYRR